MRVLFTVVAAGLTVPVEVFTAGVLISAFAPSVFTPSLAQHDPVLPSLVQEDEQDLLSLPVDVVETFVAGVAVVAAEVVEAFPSFAQQAAEALSPLLQHAFSLEHSVFAFSVEVVGDCALASTPTKATRANNARNFFILLFLLRGFFCFEAAKVEASLPVLLN